MKKIYELVHIRWKDQGKYMPCISNTESLGIFSTRKAAEKVLDYLNDYKVIKENYEPEEEFEFEHEFDICTKYICEALEDVVRVSGNESLEGFIEDTFD